ncbi:hypothetical protein Efla_006221 [Eimeria flavescens]
MQTCKKKPLPTSTARASAPRIVYPAVFIQWLDSATLQQLGVPSLFCVKKNGELRLVVDYRGLNSQAQPDKFPLPFTDVLIDKMTSFQRVMSELFKDLQFAQVYLDDIVVHSTSSHHDHLRHVFQRLQENAFPLNLSRCSFDADCIDFLGFQLSPAGVQPLAANVSSSLSVPSTFSSRTAARRFLANSPVLSIFEGSLPSRITCNASSFGIGVVLEQQHPDGWHATQFLSRTLSKPETNYPVIDNEWLAVIYALTKWSRCLQQRFCIGTDHKFLVSLSPKSTMQLQEGVRGEWTFACSSPSRLNTCRAALLQNQWPGGTVECGAAANDCTWVRNERRDVDRMGSVPGSATLKPDLEP